MYKTIIYLKAPESIEDYQEVRNVPPVDHQPPSPGLKKGIKLRPIWSSSDGDSHVNIF